MLLRKVLVEPAVELLHREANVLPLKLLKVVLAREVGGAQPERILQVPLRHVHRRRGQVLWVAGSERAPLLSLIREDHRVLRPTHPHEALGLIPVELIGRVDRVVLSDQPYSVDLSIRSR